MVSILQIMQIANFANTKHFFKTEGCFIFETPFLEFSIFFQKNVLIDEKGVVRVGIFQKFKNCFAYTLLTNLLPLLFFLFDP